MIDRNTSFQEDIAEWESAGVAVEPSIEGVNSPISNMLFYSTPDGDVLAYQYYDGSRYWLKSRDWQTGQIRVVSQTSSPPQGLAVRADYRYLDWSYANLIVIFDAQSQSQQNERVGFVSLGSIGDDWFIVSGATTQFFWRSGESLLVSSGPFFGFQGQGGRQRLFFVANNFISGSP